MKKVFFAFAVVAGLAMTACNNKTEGTDAAKTDSTATTTTTTTTEPAPVVADTTKPVVADTTKAATETKMEKKEEVKKK